MNTIDPLTPSERAQAEQTTVPTVSLPDAHDGVLVVNIPGLLLRAYGKKQLQLRVGVLIRRLSVVAKLQ